MFDAVLRAKLPSGIRADSDRRDPIAEGPWVLLLGTSAYMAVVSGLLRQLHCSPAAVAIENLRQTSPIIAMPLLWDDAPSVKTVCWEDSLHIFRAEAAIALLLLYQLTSCALAVFFSQPRAPTQLLEVSGAPALVVQPGIRRSYRFDAIARLVKLVLAIVAVFGRDSPSLVLAAATGGNALLAGMAGTTWCRPTNHEFLNSLWVGCYGAAAWTAVTAWLSYVVAAPSTWGTVGVLLVGWVAGGARLHSSYRKHVGESTSDVDDDDDGAETQEAGQLDLVLAEP